MPTTSKEEKYAVLIASDVVPESRIWHEVGPSAVFRALHCESARSMIDRLRRRPFDCLVIQDELQDCDCWRLIRIVRSGRFCSPSTPVILLCRGDPSPGFKAIAKGQNAYCAGFDDLNNLPRIIEQAIRRRKKSTVLVVEDDPDAAETARRALHADYEVEIATNGADGFSAWRRRRHDLVLLDLMLPELPGEEVLKKILAVHPKQPIIIITAHASKSRHSNLMLLGANEFVEKPFDINALRSLCRSLFHELALADADAELNEMRASVRKNVQHASSASVNLRQGNAAAAALQLDKLLVNSPQDLTDDEWVEVLEDVEKP